MNGLSLVSYYSCLHWEAVQNEYKDIEAILGGKCYLRQLSLNVPFIGVFNK